MKRKCSLCGNYIDLKDWPTYNGKLYSCCRACKRWTQRLWVKGKRGIEKSL